MKKSILYIVAATSLMLTSCDSMLDKNPRDTFTNTPEFWNNANQLESYSNGFYENYTGYANGSSYGWFYFKSLSDDQNNPDFDNWTNTTVPNTSKNWNDKFTAIRRINYLLDGLKGSSLPAAKKAEFEGIGRLNRAWMYYQLVREYGDVQWEDYAILDPNDEAVYGERTDRDVVMDNVLADLNYAVENIPASSSKVLWSKDMALAMKSDICLWEGTFCKYRTAADNGKAADATRAKKYLEESVKASEAIINSKRYSLNATYGSVYNSLDLTGNSEIIFSRHYEKDVLSHGLADFCCGSTTQRGISKDAIDAFLFTDGKPLATTTKDTNDKLVKNEDNNYSIAHLLKNKDKRLSVLIDSIVCYNGHGWVRNEPSPDGALPAEMTSCTGYTIKKYDQPLLPLYYRTNTTTGYTDAPLYWYAVILLNEAEAKAELGTITESDLDATINKLLHRADLPDMTLTPDADPANNMNVSNLIWEIRRCRRCELMCDNWYRYWDLVRWHQLDKLDSNEHPNINRGANLTGADQNGVSVDADGYMIATSATRTFNKKYYLYPIPTNELNLNKDKIQQNLGW